MVQKLQIRAMDVLNEKDHLRVLVTGSRGFIGTNLIKKLKKSRFHLVPLEENDQIIDILDRNQLHTDEDIDVIVHLASKTSIPGSTINPYDTYLTNIVGTLNVLDFARQNGIRKIINTSTFVYGPPHYLPVDEKHPVNPHSPYTKSKVIAETLCEYYAEDYAIDVVTLRPFYIYGPSMKTASFIPTIIKQIREKNKVILSSRNTKRDFLYIDDFIDLIEKLLTNFPKGNNFYNVGYGISYTLEKVVEIIKELLKIDVEVEYDDSIRPNDIVNMVADISSLRALYGWRPKIPIETGLQLTLENTIH